MLGDGHVRFGGRSAETERPKGRHRAAGRPYNLTDRQQAKLSSIQKTNARLYRAYLLKEQLRQIYRLPAKAAVELLDEWIAWARRCRLASFVKLARTITAQRAGITAAIEHGLSNARVEAINTQIRMITRRAYGFHSPRRADRAGDALPRRPLPAASAVKHPSPTHGNVRRPAFRQDRHRCRSPANWPVWINRKAWRATQRAWWPGCRILIRQMSGALREVLRHPVSYVSPYAQVRRAPGQRRLARHAL